MSLPCNRLSLLNNWVELKVANDRDPCALASDHLTIPPPCYLRLLYPEDKEPGMHTINRFFAEVEAEAKRRLNTETTPDK